MSMPAAAQIKLRPLASGRMRRVLIPTDAMVADHLAAHATSTPARLRADLTARHGTDLVCPVTLRALFARLDTDGRARLGLA